MALPARQHALRAIRRLGHLRREAAGVAFIEFALSLPLFILVSFGTLELANLTMTLMKVQRLANMTADIVAQNGVGGNQLNEMQMYDILEAMNVSAQPLDMAGNGRIIISSVLGVDSNNDGVADRNELSWQRFSGGLTTETPLLGCWKTSNTTTLQSGRQLTPGEVLYHTQVSYRYDPLLIGLLPDTLSVPRTITRTGVYRGRTSSYRTILSTDGYPPKDGCTTA